MVTVAEPISPRRRRHRTVDILAAAAAAFADQRSRITDQKCGISNDLFIDHCSSLFERRVVSLCRRGDKRFLFLDHCSLIIEKGNALAGQGINW